MNTSLPGPVPSSLRHAGRLRWLGWAVLASGFLLVNFHRMITAVMAEDLMRSFQTTGTQLGFLHASFFYIYALLQIPSGVLADRFGSRKVAMGGLILLNLGAIGFSSSTGFTWAFLSRSLIGTGGSVMYISALRFSSRWFRTNEYATMVGFTTAAAGLGGVLAATPLSLVIETFGWRTCLYGVGWGGFLLLVGIWLFAYDSPRSVGLEPVRSRDRNTKSPSFGKLLQQSLSLLREVDTWAMGTLLFFTVGANFTVMGLWGVPYVSDVYGVSVTYASRFVLAGNIGLMLGPPIIGWFSDRIQRRGELILWACVITTAMYGFLAFWGVPPLWFVGLVFFTVMFLVGGSSLTFTVIKERHPGSVSGAASGILNTLAWLGSSAMPALMGAILDFYWTGETLAGARVYTLTGYRIAFGLAALSSLVASLCAVGVYARGRRGSGLRQQDG